MTGMKSSPIPSTSQLPLSPGFHFLFEGRYSWSEGKYVEVFDSTVVELVTDEGLKGYGEVCPLGPFYLPAFGPGARAGRGTNSFPEEGARCRLRLRSRT